ncbi:MAG: glycosyltransferase family protein [Cytophagales bacterium]|nr:glycosyltransferase family protein [Cytophagales bacterium]
MKFVFVVQGEGRGHMVQAIALHEILVRNGHSVNAVLVGKSKNGTLPNFFHKNISAPIIEIQSPYFIKNKFNTGINIYKTLIYNIIRIPTYVRWLKVIREQVIKHEPDVLLNFYDFLGGFYFVTYAKKGMKHICMGHQYFLTHQDFVFPKQVNKVDKFWYMTNTFITSYKADKKLALSFRKADDLPKKNLYVVPPLLRKEVYTMKPSQGSHLLIYMVYAGFSDGLILWHKMQHDVQIDLFCDRPDLQDGQIFDQTLTVHKLNDKNFLEKMNTCLAFASTAGFESICEAMYLGKPVMMVPPKGHFEQQCNALDAQMSGAGIVSDTFDIDKLLLYLPTHNNAQKNIFRQWALQAEAMYLMHLCEH